MQGNAKSHGRQGTQPSANHHNTTHTFADTQEQTARILLYTRRAGLAGVRLFLLRGAEMSCERHSSEGVDGLA